TPFRKFESQFACFKSKRAELESIENAWVDQDFTGTDPDELDYTIDDAENTLYNVNYQIKIGGSTYEMRSDGLYDITGGGIRHSSTNSGSKIQGLCFTNKTMTKFFPDTDPNRRYKLKVAIHSIIIRSSAKGKVVSFKK